MSGWGATDYSGKRMYQIYATAWDHAVEPDYSGLTPYIKKTRSDAAKLCLFLYRDGHAIWKVVLPSGRELKRKEVEDAVKSGIRRLRALLEETEFSASA